MSRVRAAVRKESKDEREVSKEWRKLGYFEIKIEKANKAGVPDRFYAAKELGLRFWCEWKRADTDVLPGSQQERRIEELRDQGETVIVAHSREDFWRQVQAMRK